jgi:hypothetical protein
MEFLGTDGVVRAFKVADGKQRVSSNPYTYDIAEGNVDNHSAWSKIGFHAAISTNELDMMPWAAAAAGAGWTYTLPTTELTMTIVSDSAEDDTVKADTSAGSGAWTVTVYYLNGSFAEKSKTVTMNGTGAVTIATDMYRVQNARVATAGTALRAVGNLTIASAGQTYGYISATKTRMRQCVWTVPAGKTLFVNHIAFSCAQQAASKYVRFTTRANYDNKSGAVLQRGLYMPYNEIALNNTAYSRPLDPPTRLPETVDLKISAIADAAAVGTCTMSGWVETN